MKVLWFVILLEFIKGYFLVGYKIDCPSVLVSDSVCCQTPVDKKIFTEFVSLVYILLLILVNL